MNFDLEKILERGKAHLLDFIKRQRWDPVDDEKPSKKRGRKPAPPPKLPEQTLTPKRVDRFFKFE